jgi:prepilin-type processing-associated H-X9-DG protein
MLPQIEEQPLYDQFKAGGAFDGQFRLNFANKTQSGLGVASTTNGISVPKLMQTQLEIAHCPSDPSEKRIRGDQDEWQYSDPVYIAVTNYKGVADDTFLGQTFGGTVSNDASRYPSGIYDEPAPSYMAGGDRDCHNNLRCRGIFFRQSFQRPVKISSVIDGTSHTYMIGEGLPDYDDHSGTFYSNGSWSSCNLPLNNLLNVDPSTLNLAFWWDQQSFRSRHPGGAQFCMADGSVRFVSEGVDNEAYRTSCTRNGSETVAATDQ